MDPDALPPEAAPASLTEVLEAPARILPLWRVTRCSNELIDGRLVRAATKSEARAILTRKFGRLPDGTEIERRVEQACRCERCPSCQPAG